MTTEQTLTLCEALPAEMARVRDELIPAYMAVPNGSYAVSMMRADLNYAARTSAEGDVVGMIQAYTRLKEYNL